MKRFSEQFNTKASSVRLSAAEKRALRERVVSYMEYHPLSEGVPTPYVEVSPFAFFQSASWKKFQYGSVATVALVFMISLVAEQSVPGDALYAVKQVNEDVRGSLTLSSYEKVVWETELLNRRIAEARILASKGKLTEEVEVEVAKAVKEHTDNARKEIEVLKQTDQDEATLAAIEFTTALEVQTTSIQNDGGFAADNESVGLIEGVVIDATKAVEQVAVDSNLPSFDKLIAKTERETTRAYELLANIKKNATAEEQADVLRRLEDVERKISVATGLKEQEEIKAREELVVVLEQTHKLIVFMTNIDVRATLTVEEIVPVTLTEAERKNEVERKLAETTALYGLIEDKLSTSTTAIDSDIKEKVTLALGVSSTSVAEVNALLAVLPLDIVTLESVMAEGHTITKDAAALLGINEISPEVVAEPVVPAAPVEEVMPSENGTTSTSTTSEEEEVDEVETEDGAVEVPVQ